MFTPAGAERALYTASEVARFCAVDLKTVHTWADGAQLRHFRTPGRPLRFLAEDLRGFLEKFGYAVPEELWPDRPSVLVVHDDPTGLAKIRQALRQRYTIATVPDLVEALVVFRRARPDALIFGHAEDIADPASCLAQLRERALPRIPIVLYRETAKALPVDAVEGVAIVAGGLDSLAEVVANALVRLADTTASVPA